MLATNTARFLKIGQSRLIRVRTHSTATAAGEVRVRFAPSPTGGLHLGGLRTALFNYLFAKRHGGQFILRIEDTDQSRLVPGAKEGIISSLAWAGINYDLGPSSVGEVEYVQSKRLSIYKKHADILLDNGRAYRCFCSQERLQQVRDAAVVTGRPPSYDGRCSHLSRNESDLRAANGESFTLRLAMSPSSTSVLMSKEAASQVLTVDDLVFGTVDMRNAPLDDAIIIKSDGWPTYHLANVVDDHLMGVTHVLRGEEWLVSTPKHLALYHAFGWNPPRFGHLPLLLNADGTKLSKRSGDVHVEAYKEKGYLPEALINYIALLGWSPQRHHHYNNHSNHQQHQHDQRDQQSMEGSSTTGVGIDSPVEIISLPDMIKCFDLNDVNRANPIVSPEKLNWMQRIYLRNRLIAKNGRLNAAHDILSRLRVALSGRVLAHERALDVGYVADVLVLARERMLFMDDLIRECSYFFADPTAEHMTDSLKTGPVATSAVGKVSKETLQTVMKCIKDSVDNVPEWTVAELANVSQSTLAAYKAKHGALSGGKKTVMMTLRWAITGQVAGPGIADIMHLIGKDACIRRINYTIDNVV
ncbi:glutamyl-tRNA synthetase [Ramicandelaber brevisporus]|nr:glutamyl-tRNA synthetase [Ramicandelaber brevisporus]